MPVPTSILKKCEDLRLPELSLWAPGPHMLTPAVQEVLKSYQSTYSHRSTAFKDAYQEAFDLLKEVFSIPNGFTPLIFGHTGSYNWEMVVANTPSHFQTLGMDIGAFSKNGPKYSKAVKETSKSSKPLGVMVSTIKRGQTRWGKINLIWLAHSQRNRNWRYVASSRIL